MLVDVNVSENNDGIGAMLGGPRITWFASFALLVVTSILGSYFNQKKSAAKE